MNKFQPKLFIIAFIILAFARIAPAQRTTFTHQGRSTDASAGANGADDSGYAANATAAIVTVTKTADTNDGACNADCSLREAIAAAAAGDRVVFDPSVFAGTQIIELTLGELVVNTNLSVEGTGAANLIVQRSAAATSFRIFSINFGVTLNLSKITVSNGAGVTANGKTGSGGGIFINAGGRLNLTGAVVKGNSASEMGGGIHNNYGTLNVADSSIFGNTAGSFGGGISSAQAAEQTVIVNSTIKNNTAGGGSGGVNFVGGAAFSVTDSIIDSNTVNGASNGGAGVGIYSATGVIGNSIVSRNQCQSQSCNGGGVNVNASGNLTVYNSTVANNTAAFGGGILNNQTLLLVNSTVAFNSSGSVNAGAVQRAGGGSTKLRNSLIAGNTGSSTPDVYGAMTSLGNNLIGNTTGGSGFGAASNDILNPANGARISALANNGGTTETVALQSASPAINAGNDCVRSRSCANDNLPDSIVSDQRMYNRSGTIDIGAFEFGGLPPGAVLTVTKTADTNDGACNADCSLREAITEANLDADAEIIAFSIPTNDPGCDSASNHCTITLGALGALPDLSSVTIQGTGANVLTVRRDSAAQQFRIFNISVGAAVTISGLTVSGGDSADAGGGIQNSGTLALNASAVSDNTTNGFGGGGIYNGAGATLRITGSVLANNTTTGNGGGIAGVGTITIINSTVTNNSGLYGGGIITFNSAPTTLTVIAGTVSHNSSQNFRGGGILHQSDAAATISSTIVAENTAPSLGADVSGTFNSNGYNLIGSNSGATFNAATGDQIGSAGAPIDPLLGALQMNGGAVLTRALQTGSPAIDKGKSFGLTADARGFARPVDLDNAVYPNQADGADIGAFEAQIVPAASSDFASFVVTKTADTADGVCDADCSLREAITRANDFAGTDFITFNIPGAGAQTIQLAAALPDLAQSVRLLNNSGKSVTVRRDTGGDYRIFKINAGQNVRIANLNIVNGSDAGSDGGGGILNNGTLTLTNSSVSDGSTSGFAGGGIYNNVGATLNVVGSTISGNRSIGGGNGGGIAGAGTINIISSTVTGNSALLGGGIITFNGAALTISNSTITDNSAQNTGGGILEQSGAIVARGSIPEQSGAVIRSTIVADNTAAFAPDVRGNFNSEGYNLIENTTGATVAETQNPNTDIYNSDPKLGLLRDNGGATKTQTLLAGSPAIDKGKSFGATLDQRGLTRIADVGGIANAADGADIGAVELQTLSPTAASAAVGRRVTIGERGLSRARVTLTNAAGEMRTAQTSAFGYYRFEAVEAGQTYIVGVRSKRFAFAPQVVTVNEDIAGLNFAGQ